MMPDPRAPPATGGAAGRLGSVVQPGDAGAGDADPEMLADGDAPYRDPPCERLTSTFPRAGRAWTVEASAPS